MPFENQQMWVDFQKAHADSENAEALRSYDRMCANWLLNVDRIPTGQPLPPVPDMPKKKLVDDQGNITWGTFPGLAAPVKPTGQGSGGAIAATNLPPNKIDYCAYLLEKIVAKLGA